MTQPLTSGTQQPGMVPNENGNYSGQPGTNAYWRQTLAEYMASEWAYGNRQKVLDIISPSWLSAKYGEPDSSDVDGDWSARTLLAFSKWAADYQPGMSPYIDQVLPYIPPGPNDFIETPEQTAARVADQRYVEGQKEIARQFDVSTAEGKRQFDLLFNADEMERKRVEEDNRFKNELSKYGIQSANYNEAESGKRDIYSTQAGIYAGQEANRSGNLGKAGDLSMALQQAMDSRTKSALDQRADPGNYLKAEYETRALTAPEGSTSPAYSNVDSLSDVIKRLIEYQAAPAPTAPTAGTAPVAPTQATATTPAVPTAPTPNPNRPPGMLSGFANGVSGTRERQFIAGDPQQGMTANPEMIEIHNPGPNTTASITPIQKVAKAKLKGKKMYAFGDEATVTTYSDAAYQNQPRQKYLNGGSDTAYNQLSTGRAGAAFGMQVPEAGRLNYRKYMNLAKDPVALAMTAADYKSANRDLFSVVAQAKARAPLGQSVNTSMVRY